MSDAVREYAEQVATEAARNINGTVREVLLRTKSQAYLFGRLRRRFPEVAEADIRVVLAQLKHDPELEDECFFVAERPPPRGRELSSDPCWNARVDRLVDLFTVPLEPAAVLLRAETHLGWYRNFTIQVLAAAENALQLEWVEGLWRQPEPEQAAVPELLVLSTPQPEPTEEPMTILTADENAPTTTPPASEPAPAAETRAERKRRTKREWLQRKRAGSKPKPPSPAAPVIPAPPPAAASLDALLEQRVRELVRSEIRAELAKTLGDLVGKVLAA